MDAVTQTISIPYTDARFDVPVSSEEAPEPSGHTVHFNHGEELFFRLEAELTVPHLRIHHDMNLTRPGRAYSQAVRGLLRDLSRLLPSVVRDASYFFDPTDIFKLRFHRPYMYEGRTYLYLMTLDLTFRHREHTIVEPGDNDTTPLYRTRNLFIEGLLVPVLPARRGVDGQTQGPVFPVRQILSETWIGETGWGYFAKGIWMDDDLTKFFSKLFLPEGERTYPYYPLVCRYKTVCENLIDPTPAGRTARLARLHRVIDYLEPHMTSVQEELRDRGFSEDLPIFGELKRGVPDDLRGAYGGVLLRSYLNEDGMREFVLERRDE